MTRLSNLVTPILTNRGLELVQLKLTGQHRPTLQIMIDRLDHELVVIEDCVGASREISALLTIEESLVDFHHLEVTSPGMDRPLIKPRDFQRFKGQHVKISLQDLQEGRKNFVGVLEQANETSLQLALSDAHSEDRLVTIQYIDIRQAKLVPAF